ncbi:MAG: lysoplasmalogenase family protein [Aliidongia sp.]
MCRCGDGDPAPPSPCHCHGDARDTVRAVRLERFVPPDQTAAHGAGSDPAVDRSAGDRSARLLLALAMAAALAGDVLLLFPDGFILGLVAFLGTHLCYLFLFRRGVGWFPTRLAPIAVLALAGVIWPGNFRCCRRAAAAGRRLYQHNRAYGLAGDRPRHAAKHARRVAGRCRRGACSWRRTR